MNLRMTKNTFQILIQSKENSKINVKHIKDSIHPEILKKLKNMKAETNISKYILRGVRRLTQKNFFSLFSNY